MTAHLVCAGAAANAQVNQILVKGEASSSNASSSKPGAKEAVAVEAIGVGGDEKTQRKFAVVERWAESVQRLLPRMEL